MSVSSLENIAVIGYRYVLQLDPFNPDMNVDERVKALNNSARQDKYSHAQILASLVALPCGKIEEMISHHKLGDAKPLVKEALNAQIIAYAITSRRVILNGAQRAAQAKVEARVAASRELTGLVRTTKTVCAQTQSFVVRFRESNDQALQDLQRIKSVLAKVRKEQEQTKVQIDKLNKELDSLEGK